MDTTFAPIEQSLVRLNDGRMMPQLGFGVFKVPAEEAAALVGDAIVAGYRAIDTAMIYQNEEGVGAGIRDSGVPRDQIFLTTKLWNADQGYDATLRAFDASAERLGMAPDLYLIHWPCPAKTLFLETWKAFVRLQEEGRVRSIGVSNFREKDIERIVHQTGVKPVLNQIELHPRFQQVELRAYLDENDIAVESWSPLGQAQILQDPVITRIAEKHGRSAAQVVIRWHLDQGIITIPKAADRKHMVDNLSVGGFKLDDEDMDAIAALDDAEGRIGPDPSSFS
ncbi:aldo/keto reductase [Sphingomonas morindae]|uniref:Aldo/keto reductase n=1 Tax=Sphingomonas morindae TaxID=1541170 RepID=A0ABY4X586_9SPHN|nr:aldo/keto reductase [Sphingomonas morindae]USI72048.1 aldo/keto reductase [Sphingomonas morindae]